MYSTEVKLPSLPPDILYSKYIDKIIALGTCNGRIIYIDTKSRIYYDLAGKALGKFVH
jgi:hypothetical protein